jgi:hypothetical protein
MCRGARWPLARAREIMFAFRAADDDRHACAQIRQCAPSCSISHARPPIPLQSPSTTTRNPLTLAPPPSVPCETGEKGTTRDAHKSWLGVASRALAPRAPNRRLAVSSTHTRRERQHRSVQQLSLISGGARAHLALSHCGTVQNTQFARSRERQPTLFSSLICLEGPKPRSDGPATGALRRPGRGLGQRRRRPRGARRRATAAAACRQRQW